MIWWSRSQTTRGMVVWNFISQLSWHWKFWGEGPIRLQDFIRHGIVTFKIKCDGWTVKWRCSVSSLLQIPFYRWSGIKTRLSISIQYHTTWTISTRSTAVNMWAFAKYVHIMRDNFFSGVTTKNIGLVWILLLFFWSLVCRLFLPSLYLHF